MNEQSESKLVRALALPGIIALTINGVIGAGIFRVPAEASAILGIASPLAFLLAGIFAMILVLCFAELGAMYERTGGAYLYSMEAFGGTGAFLIGWIYFLARLTSTAALSNAFAGFVEYFLPIPHQVVIVGILAILGGINCIGIRSSTGVINFLTVAKLLPLFVLIAVGLAANHWGVYRELHVPELYPLGKALLLCMFVFSGFEVIAVPGAEMKNAQRDLPRGLLLGTGSAVVIYLLIQIVTVAASPGLATSTRPLSDAASGLMGSGGGAFLSVGAICSTAGTLAGLLLVGPRILYAMALNGQMPAFFSRIHERFRTPVVSTIVTTGVCMILALYNGFTKLAVLSAMARLMTYIGSAIALMILRKKNPDHKGFRAPGGLLAPVLAILISLFALSAATQEQWIAGCVAVLAGCVLFAITQKRKSA